MASEKEKEKPNQQSIVIEINESGHIQELERNFNLLSALSVGIVTGNAWAAFGGSVAIAIYNGGAPGVLYEFIAVAMFYWLITASLAELASAMPSSSGVYHWASITAGPRYGRVCGWFAGWWNTSAWICGSASLATIAAQIAVSMYSVYHPDFSPQPWNVFIAFIIINWSCCLTVMFFNTQLPAITRAGLISVLGGLIITILACAITPSFTSSEYASSSFVWKEWSNGTGWTNEGFVFCLGMLNGAFAIGTPDCTSHLAEELPNPRRNLPIAMCAQMVFGFFSTFCYAITILYAVSDIDDVLAAPFFPVARIYSQATGGSKWGTLLLCLLVFIPILFGVIGAFITSGRTLWTLARDGAVPFSSHIGTISPQHRNPFAATFVVGCITTVFGSVYAGSPIAFNAIIGSFAVLTTLSFLAAILPFLIGRRFAPGPESIKPGWFQMNNTVGIIVNSLSSGYIIVFVIIFCFPMVQPVTVKNMNYTSVVTAGFTFLAGVYYLIAGKTYVGPRMVVHIGERADHHEIIVTSQNGEKE